MKWPSFIDQEDDDDKLLWLIYGEEFNAQCSTDMVQVLLCNVKIFITKMHFRRKILIEIEDDIWTEEVICGDMA